MKWLLPLLLTLLPASLQAGVPEPRPYQATYSASYDGIALQGTRQLEKLPDQRWRLRMSASHLLMNIDEQTEFRLDDKGGIQPLDYRHRRGGLGGGKKDIDVVFDHAAGSIDSRRGKSRWALPLKPPVFDKLSYQQQLRTALIRDPRATRITLQVVDRDEIDTYTFAVLGEETLDTPMGPLKTIKLRRERKDAERETVFWLAPSLDYLLVQLEQREADSHYALRLQQATLQP